MLSALAGDRQCWVLLAEASLIGAAALGHGFGMVNFAIAAIVLAMGLEDVVFHSTAAAAGLD